jgi:hypothetical protein
MGHFGKQKDSIAIDTSFSLPKNGKTLFHKPSGNEETFRIRASNRLISEKRFKTHRSSFGITM